MTDQQTALLLSAIIGRIETALRIDKSNSEYYELAEALQAFTIDLESFDGCVCTRCRERE